MPSQAEVEAALKGKAIEGKVKAEDVLACVGSLGVSSDAVNNYLKDHKDAEGKVDLSGVVTFISSL